MASIFSSYSQREFGLITDTTYWKTIRDSDYLVRRLKQRRVLDGHHGCVNSVAWNTVGSHLISGADDCHLNFYDTSTGLLRTSIHSSHQSNIFSAKFLPCPSNCKAVSCAGIGSVEYSELTPAGNYIGHSFKCQTSITYQVATTPFDCDLFLTCEEKGCVRMFDLRVGDSCICSGCQKHVLYSFQEPVTSMAVHPLSPFYLALGLGDGSVRLLDRRMLDRECRSLASVDLMERTRTSMCRRYRPSSLANCPYKVTSVQFNPTGSELLSSYSEDYVYLFSSGVFGCGGGSAEISKPVYLSQCERYRGKRPRIDSVRSKPVSSVDSPPNSSGGLPPSNEVPPPMKRLRLRGDWSDTGPEARPGDQSSAEGSTLMNRMSRMFTQWIDMSLQNSSGNSGSSPHPESGRRREGGEEEGGREGELGTSETDSPLVTSGSSENSFHLFSDSDNGHSNNPSPNTGTDTPASSLANGLSSCNIDTGTGTGTKTHSDSSQSNRTPKSAPPDSGTVTSSNRDGGRIEEATGSSLGAAQGPEVSCLQDSEGELRKILLEPVESSSTDSLTSKQPVEECLTPRKEECHGRCNSETSESKVQEFSDEKIACSANNTSESVRRETLTLSEGVESQTQPTHKSASSVNATRSFASVVVESRTTNSAVPSIRIIDGDGTDSDDMRSCDEQQESRDKSRDRNQRTAADPNTFEEVKEEASTGDDYSSFEQPFMVYKGHRNARTMIKQANFWGENWVMSGSDCGRVFVWDKWTGKITNLLMADSHVVNCVQPHPEAYILATSGIDYDVKLWEPTAEQPSSLLNVDEIIRCNEVMLQESRNTITVPSTFVLRILAYLNRRRRLRRDAEQPPGEESDSD